MFLKMADKGAVIVDCNRGFVEIVEVCNPTVKGFKQLEKDLGELVYAHRKAVDRENANPRRRNGRSCTKSKESC